MKIPWSKDVGILWVLRSHLHSDGVDTVHTDPL